GSVRRCVVEVEGVEAIFGGGDIEKRPGGAVGQLDVRNHQWIGEPLSIDVALIEAPKAPRGPRRRFGRGLRNESSPTELLDPLRQHARCGAGGAEDNQSSQREVSSPHFPSSLAGFCYSNIVSPCRVVETSN